MFPIVEIVENIDVKKFKNDVKVELEDFNRKGLKTDIKFSTCKIHDGNRENDGILYTAMIIGSN